MHDRQSFCVEVISWMPLKDVGDLSEREINGREEQESELREISCIHLNKRGLKGECQTWETEQPVEIRARSSRLQKHSHLPLGICSHADNFNCIFKYQQQHLIRNNVLVDNPQHTLSAVYHKDCLYSRKWFEAPLRCEFGLSETKVDSHERNVFCGEIFGQQSKMLLLDHTVRYAHRRQI